MDYFDKKADQFLTERFLPDRHRYALAHAMKEVARDQRHACAEAVKDNHGVYDREATDRAASVAMSANL